MGLVGLAAAGALMQQEPQDTVVRAAPLEPSIDNRDESQRSVQSEPAASGEGAIILMTDLVENAESQVLLNHIFPPIAGQSDEARMRSMLGSLGLWKDGKSAELQIGARLEVRQNGIFLSQPDRPQQMLSTADGIFFPYQGPMRPDRE